MWTRPALCRLCECPASDGGVQIDQLDSAKFTKWWLCKIGTDFQPEAPETKEIICNFCICDARLEHEYSVNDSDSDGHVGDNWWSGHDVNLFFGSYYLKKELFQPCSVDMGLDAFKVNNNEDCKKSNERIMHLSRHGKFIGNTGQRITGFNEHKGSKELQRCLICDQAFKWRATLIKHLRKHHAGSFVLCNHNQTCSQIFRTEAEKSDHLLTVTKFMKIEKCNFCHRTYTRQGRTEHLRIYHANEKLVRCGYFSCATYFRTEVEKQNHEALIHQTEEKHKCIFCSLFFYNKSMLQHFKRKHKSQIHYLIRCKFKCRRYFLTDAEHEEHVAKVHEKILIRSEAKCIYCNKICIDKNSLYIHVKNMHSEIGIWCKFRNCFQYFHTQIQADLHFKQQHQKIEEKKQFRCLKCDYRSATKVNCKKHIMHVHGNRNLRCPKCTKSFSSPITFKQHLKFSHAAPKVCQYCDSKLKSLRYHSTQKKCQRCQKVLMCVRSAQLHKNLCKLQTDPGGKILSF